MYRTHPQPRPPTDHVVYNDRNYRVVQLNNHTYYVNPIIHLSYDGSVLILDISGQPETPTPVPALYLQIDLCPSTTDTSANVTVNGPYDVSGGGLLYDISGNYPTTDMTKPFPYVIYICDHCSRASMVPTPTPAPTPAPIA